MESFFQDLRAFEAEHSWWSSETFSKLDNSTLQAFTKRLFQKHVAVIHPLIQEGTAQEMDAFQTTLQQRAPKMLVATLVRFLDQLHTVAEKGENVSHSVVAWYRQKGWKFPEFPHEVSQEKLSLSVECLN
jgi:hypothetical protein